MRVVRDTRQERTDSVQQHWHTLGGRQSFIQMHTVADRLASLSYPKNEHRKRKTETKKEKKKAKSTIYNS